MHANPRSPGQGARWRYYTPGLLAITAGLLLSIMGFIAAQRHQRRSIEAEFTMASTDRVSALRRDIKTDLFFLESLDAFYRGSAKVERADFQQFVEHFLCLPQHGAIQALEWVPCVPHSRRARYEEELREEGFGDFQIAERKPDGVTVRAADRKEYFPVHFVEPYEGNETAVGLDLGSDPGVLDALRRARDTGQMAATGRITLVQKSVPQNGLLVCLPVYRKGAVPHSAEERRANLEGFVVGVFRISAMMETALAYLEPQNIDIFLDDDSAVTGDRFLYLRLAGGGSHDGPSGKRREGPYAALSYSATIDVAGRQWLVACTSTPAHFAAGKTWQPWMVMVAGVLSTGLLAAYIFTLLRGMVRARKSADDMLKAKQTLEQEITERKRASEAILAAKQEWERTFDVVPDLIAIIDDQHRIRRVNQTMANRLGKTPQQCIGLNCYEAIHGMDHPPAFCPHALTCADGKEHTADVHADRLGGDFLVTTTPMLDLQGQFIGSVHVAHDVTGWKRVSEEGISLATVLDVCPDFVGFADAKDGHICHINKAGRLMVGVGPDEDVTALKIADLHPEWANRKLTETILPAAARNGVWTGDCAFLHRDGHEIPVVMSLVAHKTPSGEVEVFSTVSHDITERKRMEDALRESEARHRALIETTGTGFVVTDGEGRVLDANAEFVRLTGRRSLDEIRGRSIMEMTAVHDRERSAEAIRKCLSGVPVKNLEIGCVDSKGNVTPIEINAAVVTTGGTPIILTLCRDITERKRAEEALARLAAIVETTPDFVGFADAKDTHLAYINRAGRRMIGISDDEDVSKMKIADFHPDWTNKLLSDVALPTAAREGLWEGECAFLNRDGREIPVLMVLQGHRGAGGEIETFSTISRDITDRKKAEEALGEARKQAEERALELQKANRRLSRAVAEKDDFLRAVSHDLSAPLRNIGGMAAFLKSQYAGCLDENGRDRLDRILNNVAVQNGLIQDLLELSHIKTRRGKMHQTDLDAMLRAMVGQFAFDLEKKSGRIDLTGEFPVLWCETNRIRQVFQNLVDNAIKYAHPDRPLQVAVIGQRDDHGYRFTVADNGIGMRKQDMEAIFFVFRRVHNAYTAKIEGKGVGLATVKTIVESHGGEIWVESQEGFGSSFTFTLPASAVAAPPETESESVSAG